MCVYVYQKPSHRVIYVRYEICHSRIWQRRNRLKFLVWVCVLFFVQSNLYAHSWDEPWHKEVVTGADTLALFEVVEGEGHHLILKRIRHLAGEKTTEVIHISQYYLMGPHSVNLQGDGLIDRGLQRRDLQNVDLKDSHHPFGYAKGQRLYGFVRKHNKGYAIATPTAGLDDVLADGSVAATFRHSLHRTKMQPDTYENLQVCIFKALHNQACDPNTIDIHILKPLSKKVAALSAFSREEEVTRFFQQHAALESVYLLSYDIPLDLLTPFLNSYFSHVQVSAVRALSASRLVNKDTLLAQFVVSEDSEAMAKIMAVILLSHDSSSRVNAILKAYLPLASQDIVTLGALASDPRAATWYPDSVKRAIQWFLEKP